MRLFLSMAAACLALGLCGCVPVLIGGAFYKSTKTADEKAAFRSTSKKTILNARKHT